MRFKVESKELLDIITNNPLWAEITSYDEKEKTARITIPNAVRILEDFGVELKLSKLGNNVCIMTAGVSK